MIPQEIAPNDNPNKRAQFLAAAREAGFELAGVAQALPLEEFSFYRQWLADGMAGPMGYLEGRRGEVRGDPREVLESAKSVLCVGKLYHTDGPGEPAVARYAWGQSDYHDLIRERLERIVERLRALWGPFEAKICVDTAPLLERGYARAAGLGWIGKNTCLINEPAGSWFLLGEVLVSVELPPDAPPPDRCGTCRRCIDACPTQAIVPAPGGGWRLDGRACISTWTIEQKGALPEAWREASGPRVFGCDICQEVCPWNRRAPMTGEPGFQPVNADPDLLDLAALTPDGFRERFRRTPLWRTKYSGLLRNVATAMGNSGDLRYLEPLRKLAENEDESVRAHAFWALRRLEGRG